jgi:CubicO group peptidase (beta-lactamase class C family)
MRITLDREKLYRAFQTAAISLFALVVSLSSAFAVEPVLPGIDAAMQEVLSKKEVAGAVTMVVTKDKVLHLQTHGFANVAAGRKMTPDTIFWIASMTKPVTAAAVLKLQDAGKLKVSDPVAKYIPEFANLKTPSGKPANLTITQILTHTSGLGEAPRGAPNAKTLADLVPLWVAAPMQFEPGSKWSYCQSGINTAARIVEVVSGLSFDAYLEKEFFAPLGMKDTGFYPTDQQRPRLAALYLKDKDTGELKASPARFGLDNRSRPPLGNAGLFSTAPDYARFCQMLLDGGAYEGRRYLSRESVRLMSQPQTGALPTGFFQSATWGSHGTNYAWGIGTCILKTPHEGVAAMLSPGTFGHGGAFGTQAWIDPVKGIAYVLMVQRSNFPNSDASDVRRLFQEAAAKAIPSAQETDKLP